MPSSETRTNASGDAGGGVRALLVKITHHEDRLCVSFDEWKAGGHSAYHCPEIRGALVEREAAIRAEAEAGRRDAEAALARVRQVAERRDCAYWSNYHKTCIERRSASVYDPADMCFKCSVIAVCDADAALTAGGDAEVSGSE